MQSIKDMEKQAKLNKTEGAPQFSRLTPAQAEKLAILMEECAEVQQIIGKILRHGFDSKHPDGGPTNRELLEKEVGDVQYAIGMLTGSYELSLSAILLREAEKRENIQKYLHHN